MADIEEPEETSRLIPNELRLRSSASSGVSSPSPLTIGKYFFVAAILATSIFVTFQNSDYFSSVTNSANFQALVGTALPVTNIQSPASEVATLNTDVMASSPNEDALPGQFRMMSLIGATPDSSFNECTSTFRQGAVNQNIKVAPGCVSLFNSDLSVRGLVSTMITFCGCETIGPKKYDFVALQAAGLISKQGGGLISYIATGDGASATLYNSPEFESEFKTVIGPNTQISAKRIVMGESTWDNAIYSIVMQSWTPCDLAPVVCAPVVTQSPVASPTLSPFIQPTARPTKRPIVFPTAAPSTEPTVAPTMKPHARPTMEPLAAPTLFPTMDPTKSPISVPSHYPTKNPLAEPSQQPTEMPILRDPTLMPTMAPTMDPRIVICKGKLASTSKIVPGKTYPKPGCASFFWRDVDELESSFISTICSCGEVGQLIIPNDMMAKVGAARGDGFPTISSIITGYNTSLSIYATPDLSGVDKYVMGPQEVADLSLIQRKSGSGAWNDKTQSISLMAWNQCTQHLFTDSCFEF